jgi:hypothetical protein
LRARPSDLLLSAVSWLFRLATCAANSTSSSSGLGHAGGASSGGSQAVAAQTHLSTQGLAALLSCRQHRVDLRACSRNLQPAPFARLAGISQLAGGGAQRHVEACTSVSASYALICCRPPAQRARPTCCCSRRSVSCSPDTSCR